jgi:hypothetical protein
MNSLQRPPHSVLGINKAASSMDPFQDIVIENSRRLKTGSISDC